MHCTQPSTGLYSTLLYSSHLLPIELTIVVKLRRQVLVRQKKERRKEHLSFFINSLRQHFSRLLTVDCCCCCCRRRRRRRRCCGSTNLFSPPPSVFVLFLGQRLRFLFLATTQAAGYDNLTRLLEPVSRLSVFLFSKRLLTDCCCHLRLRCAKCIRYDTHLQTRRGKRKR